MFKSMLGFITGVILLYFSWDLINTSQYSLNFYGGLLIAVSSLLLLYYRLLKGEGLLLNFLCCFLFLVLGFLYAQKHAQTIQNARLSSDYDQSIVLLTGFLCGLPTSGKYSFSADFCVLNLSSTQSKSLIGEGFKARLKWPLTKDIAADITTGVNILSVKIKQPKSSVNFIGIPYENSLFYKRVVLVGKVQSLESSHTVESISFFSRCRYHYHQLRKSIKHYSDKLLNGMSQQGIIHALLLGDKSHLTGEHYKVLADTGTQHLIAISGLHVGLVMLGVYWLLPTSRLTILIVSVVGLCYVLLVGFAPSAQRAWLMCVAALLYLSGHLNLGKWRVYSMTLCLVLVLDPLSTFNLGFWYSFVCVAILFLLSQTLFFKVYPFFALICLQCLLFSGMIPVASMLGTKHGIENILANCLAIPWISLLVLPVTLLWFLMSFIFENVANHLLELLNTSVGILMAYLSSLKAIHMPVMVSVNWLSIFGFCFCFVAMLIFHRVKAVFIMCMVGIVLAVVYPSRLDKSNPELLVFDVGQGLALAFKTHKDIWLYDTGPAFSKRSSTEQVILPYLRRYQKTNELTGLIISHGDADHASDLQSLYHYTVPQEAWTSQPARLDVNGFNVCEQGMNWQNAGLQIEILYPFSAINVSEQSANNHSCVARVVMMGKVFLLMGDLEGATELALVSHYRERLKADVLIAGHHGAANSSSFALLKYVQPDHVVFSAGYMNKFGHPSSAVVKRLSTFKVRSYNTAELGALRFEVDSVTNKLSVSTAR